MARIDPRYEHLLEDDWDEQQTPEQERKPAPSAAKQQRRQTEKERGKAISGSLKDLKRDRRNGKP